MEAAGAHAAQHMDRMYRYQRHIYDLTRRYYLLGRETMLAQLAPPDGGSVLEVGCGTGRNLIQTADLYPDAALYGFDISSEMLGTAARKVAAKGATSRIRLAQADATAFDPERTFGRDRFDRVFVSYALSMIPPWREALDRAWLSVAPGGALHIVDFGQQERLPDWFRTLLLSWLRQFSVTPRGDLEGALAILAQEAGADLRFDRLFRGYAWHAVVRKAPED